MTTKLRERVHGGQDEVLSSDARFRILACGRRWGKTVVCSKETREDLLKHGDGWLTWWVAPTYQQAEIGLRTLQDELRDEAIADINRSKLRLEATTGAVCAFKSADQPDNLRGEGVNKLIIDEAAEVSQYAYENALRPTLTDTTNSQMIAISTPQGRGWFYRLWERGNSDDWPSYQSWQRPTTDNQFINRDDVDEARETIPEQVFRQEYLAEFVDESGGVFDELDERLFTADYDLKAYDGTEPYAAGWDFARHEDFFVGIVLDADGDVVHYHRSQGDAWPQIQRTIERVAGEYHGLVALDASRDNKVVADLTDALGRGRVEPVTFSPKRKRELIEDLIATVEAGELTAPDIPQLRHELEIFEYDVTPSGTVRYDAPAGFHDDSVDALALAVTARAGKRNQAEIRRRTARSNL